MNNIFKSILKDEMMSFMKFIKKSIADLRPYWRTLLDFDAFLYAEHLEEKKIDAAQLKNWLGSLNVHISTKKSKLSQIKRFSAYLSTLGIPASLPELPKKTSKFKPYVFSEDEMTQIFETADDFTLTSPNSKIAAEFPILLRILYGCGLRLGEAEALAWEDIDLDSGVITIKTAKNQKQRIIPMSDELTRILKLYRTSSRFDGHHVFLFTKSNGQRRNKGAYWQIFNRILFDIGIKNSQNTKHGSRGPCIHSLRHTFTINSLLKAEAEGRGFWETVPFLSTYLGHEGLMQTDIYLKARYELYTASHKTIADYTCDVFPHEASDEM